MAGSAAAPLGQDGEATFPGWQRAVGIIALGAGLASFSMNFWIPFLPIYMQDLGAGSDEQALFWSALAMSSNGVLRFIGGPLWGVLSDRFGRKPMYVRALFGATVTTLIALVATEPWHVCVAMGCQGLVSGFIPAAVALTSVSVPQSRMNNALGTVQGAQYTGSTIGPAVGGLLAAVLGLRGAILAGALMPAIGAVMVLVAVPRDRIVHRAAAVARTTGGWSRQLAGLMGLQFALGLLLYFSIFVMNQLVRTAAPVAIGQLQGESAATGATGVAFTVAGLASIAGALVLSRYMVRTGRMRPSLTVVIAVAAVAQVLLGLADSVLLFTAWFALISLAQGAMMPATNTIIAASVPQDRRGTAFGIASSVQALSFIVGPMGAALFAAVSFRWGFIALGAAFAATGLAIFLALREPDLTDAAPTPAGEPKPDAKPESEPELQGSAARA